jgi:hypothetical protein
MATICWVTSGPLLPSGAISVRGERTLPTDLVRRDVPIAQGGLAYRTHSSLARATSATTGTATGTPAGQWALDLRGGLLYTDGLGGAVPSSHAQRAVGAGPTSELFPLPLAAQRIVFLRGFISWTHVYAGLDAEVNPDFDRPRSSVQVGYAQ